MLHQRSREPARLHSNLYIIHTKNTHQYPLKHGTLKTVWLICICCPLASIFYSTYKKKYIKKKDIPFSIIVFMLIFFSCTFNIRSTIQIGIQHKSDLYCYLKITRPCEKKKHPALLRLITLDLQRNVKVMRERREGTNWG